MRFVSCLLASLVLSFPFPSKAVVEGEMVNDAQVRSFTVRIESASGELCSGVLIGQDIVLTAAHCVDARGRYTVFGIKPDGYLAQQRSIAAAIHPQFVPVRRPRDQHGIDLALLMLEAPLGETFDGLSVSSAVLGEGDKVRIYGFGTTSENRRTSSRILRGATLLVSGTLQTASNQVQVLVDPVKQGMSLGKGACKGDSGGPVLSGETGTRLAGLISWSSGPNPPQGCGGTTAITPLAPHAAWIHNRMRSLRDASQNAGTPAALVGGNYDWTVRGD